jgi:hypothetical protein
VSAEGYQRVLNSFSGTDLQVSFESRVIAELQQIAYSVEREKVAIFTLGSPNPRSFARGKRGIGGSLIFLMFDRDALQEELKKVWNQFAPPVMFTGAGDLDLARKDGMAAALEVAQWNEAADRAEAQYEVVSETNPSYLVNVPAGFTMIGPDNIVYADTLPPFNITMTWANEYGAAAFQKIYQAEIVNEGMGASIDTVVLERPLSFVCRKISPICQGVYRSADGGMFKALEVVKQRI